MTTPRVRPPAPDGEIIDEWSPLESLHLSMVRTSERTATVRRHRVGPRIPPDQIATVAWDETGAAAIVWDSYHTRTRERMPWVLGAETWVRRVTARLETGEEPS